MDYWIVSAVLLIAFTLGGCNKPVTATITPVPVVFPTPAIPKDISNPPEGASRPMRERKAGVILVRQTTIRESVEVSPVFTL